ncbi:MAG: S8 family serine peptidase, partial [Bacteroidota bacterium]
MPLKFLNQDGTGFASDAVAALEYARQKGAQLSNNSWGSAANNQTLAQSIAQAAQEGHIFVAAAGNNYGNNNDLAPIYPAAYSSDNIIAVTATDEFDRLTNFANIGPASVDLAAPGYAIFSTLPGGQYGYLSGTSMAAPQVAGAICLLWSARPNLSYQGVINRLIRNTRSLENLQGKCLSSGRLDARRALERPLLYQKWYPLSGPIAQMDASVWRSQIQLLLQKQDSLHHLRFGLDGQLLDSRSLYTGIGGSGVGTAAEFLFYEVPALGGNPNLLAQRYDQSHMLDFESNFGGAQNERFLAATANQAGRVWHASLSNSFGTRDLYLVSMDSASIYWERPFPLATNQELGGLLRPSKIGFKI